MENFIKHTQVSPAAIESRLKHPITNELYPHRTIFEKLKNYSTDFFKEGAEPRMIALAGLRGVGKTTLLWQMANHIYGNHTNKVYFFNVNTIRNLGASLFQTLELFQVQILQKRFHECNEPIVLLFDEVHDDEDWASTLKILYDEARWCFIVATGSSALLLNSTADLARRMHIEKIYPFSFTEYLKAKKFNLFSGSDFEDTKSKLQQALFFSESSEEAYIKLQSIGQFVADFWNKIELSMNNGTANLIEEYISHHNIPAFLIYKDTNIVNESIIELFKRVIQEDIPKITETNTNSFNIEKILYRLSGSDEVNIESLSNTFGIKKDEVQEIIEILFKAELIHVLFPYGGIDCRLNKNKKAFFMSPSLRKALLYVLYGSEIPETFQSKLLEDLVVLYIKRILPNITISYPSELKDVNPDFVIETRTKPILLETGMSKKSIRQINKTRFDYRYGIIVSYHNTDMFLKDNIIHLPLRWFLFM